jgi:hypothetical protein
VNAIKVVFGDTLPIEVCALENNKNSTITTRKSAIPLNSSKLEEYQIIAEEINERKDIGLVCIQHEFGLLAEYGDYVLAFISFEQTNCHYFHTVLPYPDENENCSCYSRFV